MNTNRARSPTTAIMYSVAKCPPLAPHSTAYCEYLDMMRNRRAARQARRKRPLSGHLSRCPEILPGGVHQLSTDISATKTPHYPPVDTARPEMFVLVLISAYYG